MITLATTSLVLLPVTAQAVDFEVSGQINRLIMSVDNGEENGVVHADNSASGTRVRRKGPGVFTEDDGETKLQWSTDKNQSTTTAAVATGDSGLDEKAEFEQFKVWNELKTKGADSEEFLQWLDYQKFKNSQ